MVGSQVLSWGAAPALPPVYGRRVGAQPALPLIALPPPAQGFSAHWWNFRHFQHHAKPNIFHKDPDVTVAPVFLLGESSVEVGGEGCGCPWPRLQPTGLV